VKVVAICSVVCSPRAASAPLDVARLDAAPAHCPLAVLACRGEQPACRPTGQRLPCLPAESAGQEEGGQGAPGAASARRSCERAHDGQHTRLGRAGRHAPRALPFRSGTT
jgi:hypothetical protein